MSTWVYDGSNLVTVTSVLATADEASPGLTLNIDDGVNNYNGPVGGSLGATVTFNCPVAATGPGGSLTAGDTFIAELTYTNSLSGRDVAKEARIFTYGTAGAGVPYAPTWSYDGSGTLTFTLKITTLDNLNGLSAYCSDFTSTNWDSAIPPGAVGSTVSGTVTGIGGLSPGDWFGCHLTKGSGFFGTHFDLPLRFGSPSSSGGFTPTAIVTANYEGDWRFDLCEGGASNPTAGKRILSLNEHFHEPEFNFDLNRPFRLEGRVRSDDLVNQSYDDGYPLLSDGDRTIKAYQWHSGAWALRYTGIIWQLMDEADGNGSYTKVTAFDPFQFLYKRLMRRPSDGKFTKKVVINNYGGNVIQNQINRTITHAGPCYIRTDGTIDTTAFLSFEWEQEYVAPGIMEITDTGTCDVIFEPVDQTDGILSKLSCKGRRGSDRSATVLFEWDTGAKVSAGWQRELDMETAANYVTNLSGNKRKHSTQQHSGSQSRFGVMESCSVLTDIVHQDLLDALTTQELAERANPRELVTTLPQPNAGTKRCFIDYFIGDEVGVACSNKAREATSGVQRIYGITLKPMDGYDQVTELRTVPET